MKLSDVALKEIKAVGLYNLGLTVIENMGFLLLGYWDTTVLLGSIFGYLVTTLCFVLLCLSVQKAMGRGEEGAKSYMQFTYMGRMAIFAAALILAMNVSFLNWVSVVITFIFTRISILIITFVRREK